MRISGGAARGIPLLVPKGDSVRPATDGMRQSVFSSLGARISGAAFVDLFAGSGAYGLEAISRGAERGVFVEKNSKAANCIRKNVTAVCKSVGREESALHVTQSDVLAYLQRSASLDADLVFIDPPYEVISEISGKLFAELTRLFAQRSDPVVIFEMPGELALEPVGWVCVKRLGKGARQPTVAFFRKETSVNQSKDAAQSAPPSTS